MWWAEEINYQKLSPDPQMSATAGHTPDRQDRDRQAGMQAHTHTGGHIHTRTHAQ